jgi:glycogen operon protein
LPAADSDFPWQRQFGNNNAYCQGNETSWFDWTLFERHADVHRFVTRLNARRILRSTEHERRRMTLNELIQQARKTWHGVKLGQPDWGRDSHSLAFEVELRQEDVRIFLILNAYWEPLSFELPPAENSSAASWRRWIDTSLESPHDVAQRQAMHSLSGCTYLSAPRSTVVLIIEVAGGMASQRTSTA